MIWGKFSTHLLHGLIDHESLFDGDLCPANETMFLSKTLNLVLLDFAQIQVTLWTEMTQLHIDGLVQYCSNSSALAMELLQSCTKPAVYMDH